MPTEHETTEGTEGARATEHLQDLALASEDVGEFLQELAVRSANVLSEKNDLLSSVTLRRRKKPVTVAFNTPKVKDLDELQYGAGTGPCLTALDEHATIHVPDVREETRWPDYTPTAWAKGVGSILAVPLSLEDEAAAALNLYATRTHAFSGPKIQEAESLAGQVSRTLRIAVRISQLTEDRRNLLAAMQSRTAIDMAVGAIMAQNRCSQEAAMKILRIASSGRNVKLRDVAAVVVTSIARDPAVLTHFDD
ncbi:GAF and ANTAR domain-containing protein [Paenarthrobacter sp. CM16]|uniref:GAF and ANTAR domain-containing protein n=1 Tax=Paenarthrobacter sp. CM16 TaxID=2738447 RepID=UPI001553379D|nr:GAF and ANTAR domain-containing protein [Paenarthrobacter sp. CM16]NQD89564.1 GAF and ANTAR domain-containing protein [Paenarthrobacter sp. CM16]